MKNNSTTANRLGDCVYCDKKALRKSDQDGYDISFSYYCDCVTSGRIQELQSVMHENRYNLEKAEREYELLTKCVTVKTKGIMLANLMESSIIEFGRTYGTDADSLLQAFAIIMSNQQERAKQ